MVASRKTIEDVYGILNKHLTPSDLNSILNDLKEVKGNKSFTQTIESLILLQEGLLRNET